MLVNWSCLTAAMTFVIGLQSMIEFEVEETFVTIRFI